MFESYSDTITLDATVADKTYRSRVLGKLLGLPKAPVKVTGGAGTEKLYVLEQTVRESGYRLVLIHLAELEPNDTRIVRAKTDIEHDRHCVLVIDEAEDLEGRRPVEREQLTTALRELVDSPNVAVTFVVETTSPRR